MFLFFYLICACQGHGYEMRKREGEGGSKEKKYYLIFSITQNYEHSSEFVGLNAKAIADQHYGMRSGDRRLYRYTQQLLYLYQIRRLWIKGKTSKSPKIPFCRNRNVDALDVGTTFVRSKPTIFEIQRKKN